MKLWDALGLLGLVGVSLLASCAQAPPPLPVVEYASLDEARVVMVQRQQAVRSAQAQCELRITPPPKPKEKTKTQTLDGAIVLDGDQRVRLRTWKLSQTIFDLTRTEGGAFLVVSDELVERAPEAKQGLAKLADHLPVLLHGRDFSDVYLQPDTDPTLLRGIWSDSYVLIDRRTLTPVRFVINDRTSKTSIELVTEYISYDGVYWLRRVVATGDFGTFEVLLRDVKLNAPLNPSAFKPPRRAQRL